MSNITILVVGMGSVLLIFVILYIIFAMMGKIFYAGQRKKRKDEEKAVQMTATKVEERTEERTEQDEPIEAAIVAAVMAYMSSEVKQGVVQPKGRIYSFEERTMSWRKSGWKGARGWRASSGW